MADTNTAELLNWVALLSGKGQRIETGRMSHIDASGRPFVFLEKQAEAPVLARSMVQALPGEENRILDKPILVLREEELSEPPIILGVIHDRIVDKKSSYTGSAEDRSKMKESVSGSGHRRLALDAEEEIQLRVGKSSIHLRRDGKIYIKGSTIVSRASRVQKIKGSAVKIN